MNVPATTGFGNGKNNFTGSIGPGPIRAMQPRFGRSLDNSVVGVSDPNAEGVATGSEERPGNCDLEPPSALICYVSWIFLRLESNSTRDS